MTKVILTAITIILIGLLIYSYTSTNEEHKITSVEKVPVPKVIFADSKKIISPAKKEVPTPKLPSKVKRDIEIDIIAEDHIEMRGEASLESSEIIEMYEETPERILEIEEASGLTDLRDEDNTPMETEKMVF